MARARNIKPKFFTNEDLAEQPFEVRLLFIGLWCIADREGRLGDRPKKIKMEIFPADSVDVDKLLQRLHDAKFIHRYQAADGKGYIQILTFQKHQNPHHREPQSTIPPPSGPGFEAVGTVLKPEAEDLFKVGQAQGEPGASPADSGFRIPDSPSPNPEEKPAPSAPPSPPPRRVNGHDQDHGEVVERIPLCDGTEFEVRKSFVDELDRLFPAVDPVQTLREIRAWNLANQRRRKTRKGVKGHITTWFGKEQDKHSARAS